MPHDTDVREMEAEEAGTHETRHEEKQIAGISRRALIGGGLALAGGALLGLDAQAAPRKKRQVVVWSEGTAPKNVYPNDVNTAIAEGLKPLKAYDIVIANLSDAEQGLPDSVLNNTDVLIWWGHRRHDDVKDELVQRITRRVKEDGMGFLPTHSAHFSKPLKAILGTPCSWSYYIPDGARVDVIVQDPRHPIARGVKNFTVPHTERYGDPFQVPTPEAVIFDGIYTLPDGKTGEHAQQGMVWTIGKGRVFYFQLGHETYPIYDMPEVQQIFRNGVQWATPKK